MKNEHSGHRQRMKKQFVRTGAECFYDHQLLELLLFFSITQSDTNVIAHSLINRFGSVSGVFKASYDELMEVKGISEVSAQLLRLVAELSDLEHCRTQTESYVEGVEGMLEILKSEFYGKDKSEARIICADDSLGITEIISFDGDEIFENSHRIVSDILASGCSQAVIAVYRPDSEAYPTDEDKTFARYLRRTLKAYNIILSIRNML